jgi:tetratricopeptide (TPR) repeat protein
MGIVQLANIIIRSMLLYRYWPLASEEPAMTNASQPSLKQLSNKTKSFLWLHIAIIITALMIVLFPYYKNYLPIIDKTLAPGIYYQQIGDQYVLDHKYEQAIENYHNALNSKGIFGTPKKRALANIHHRLAFCHINLKQYQQAIGHALKSADIDPKWLEPYIILADIYSQIEDLDNFQQLARRLRLMFHDQWQSWISMGNGYLRLHRSNAAIYSYKRALSLLYAQYQQMSQRDALRYDLERTHQRLQRQLHDLETQIRLAKISRTKLADSTPKPDDKPQSTDSTDHTDPLADATNDAKEPTAVIARKTVTAHSKPAVNPTTSIAHKSAFDLSAPVASPDTVAHNRKELNQPNSLKIKSDQLIVPPDLTQDIPAYPASRPTSIKPPPIPIPPPVSHRRSQKLISIPED